MTTRQHTLLPATLTTLITAAILTLATSCVISTTVDEIEKPFGTKESNPTSTDMGYITLTLRNNAENTLLLLDSIELCNIKLNQTTKAITISRHQPALQLPNQTSTTSPGTTIPAQEFIPWTPDKLPEESTSSYIKIHGKLYTYLADGKTMLHCPGPMYTPLYGYINPGKSTNIIMEMYDNCPIYFKNNGVMTKALRAIGFDANIVDWE